MTNTNPRPIPFHTDQASLAAREHDGRIPLSWSVPTTPSEFYAKAAVIAAVSWEAVRNTDPPFPACAISHRERLIAEVEALLKSGPPSDQTVLERLQLPGDTDTGDI